MRKLITVILLLGSLGLWAQESQLEMNSADRLMDIRDQKLIIGGYGQIDYNQPLIKDQSNNGTLDVHRLVLLFGYNFTEKLQLFTEIELEHVKEVYVEQVFLNYKFNNYFQVKGGLMLIPMGIINELHEPTVYFGVERPLLDKKIVPTTWREIGLGIHGNIQEISLKYQLYMVNGFLGYDDQAKFRGSDGFRKGRQKGAESIASSPNLSAKIDYYGIPRLKLGLATYLGKSQSNLFDGLPDNDPQLQQQADSSIVDIAMFGVDATYRIEGIQLRGQLVFVNNGNVDQYNDFGGSDLGQQMFGYYAEAGYNVFKTTKFKSELIPFVRYEFINTHHETVGFEPNKSFETQLITSGLNWKINSGVVLKIDYQWIKTAAQSKYDHAFNAGLGFVF
ncbi:hypothetical protein [Lentimicrobium sp. S6]|uniref:hypothetical protein n=1 Tax=Lentimicrobium sp. S6 TaxID=2735872 RepID=UPI001556C8A7|nr:hypothetical protein [Lentimicrobium sp. S6]NPD43998.1 hypothetical protein [Lentimicrobium sp. S6]